MKHTIEEIDWKKYIENLEKVGKAAAGNQSVIEKNDLEAKNPDQVNVPEE